MDKHLYIFFDENGKRSTVGGTWEFTHSDQSLDVDVICSEGFANETANYHWQAQYRAEALAYLQERGIVIPEQFRDKA